ncbi:MAG: hypothetical protein NVSMB24_38380 [Mucilaginibacter sp.]
MELEEKLYQEVLQKRGITLNELQDQQFRYACMKVIPENPGAGYFDLMAACHIYLNFILNNPQIDLGPIKVPMK